MKACRRTTFLVISKWLLQLFQQRRDGRRGGLIKSNREKGGGAVESFRPWSRSNVVSFAPCKFTKRSLTGIWALKWFVFVSIACSFFFFFKTSFLHQYCISAFRRWACCSWLWTEWLRMAPCRVKLTFMLGGGAQTRINRRRVERVLGGGKQLCNVTRRAETLEHKMKLHYQTHWWWEAELANRVTITASQKCIGTGPDSCALPSQPCWRLRLVCGGKKKPTSPCKVVEGAPVHEKCPVMYSLAPWGQRVQRFFDTSRRTAPSPVLCYSLIINLLQIWRQGCVPALWREGRNLIFLVK